MATRREAYGAVPPRLPAPPEELVGRVFHVPPGQTFFWLETRRIEITRVRVDISLWYDGEWVWVEGDMLDNFGRSVGPVQALVSVSVFHPAPPRG